MPVSLGGTRNQNRDHGGVKNSPLPGEFEGRGLTSLLQLDYKQGGALIELSLLLSSSNWVGWMSRPTGPTVGLVMIFRKRRNRAIFSLSWTSLCHYRYHQLQGHQFPAGRVPVLFDLWEEIKNHGWVRNSPLQEEFEGLGLTWLFAPGSYVHTRDPYIYH